MSAMLEQEPNPEKLHKKKLGAANACTQNFQDLAAFGNPDQTRLDNENKCFEALTAQVSHSGPHLCIHVPITRCRPTSGFTHLCIQGSSPGSTKAAEPALESVPDAALEAILR